jgi:hypothetical protein
VELVEADGVDAEPLERALDGLAQVGGGAVDGPRAVTGTQVAALGRDQHAGGVAAPARQRLGDQRLVVADLVGVQVVGVGRIDQGHAGVERGVDRPDRAVGVGPSLDGHRHAAESDGADLDVSDGSLLHAARRTPAGDHYAREHCHARSGPASR